MASESVVVVDLELSAELKRVRSFDPGEVVVVGIDGVFRTVVGGAAPGRIVIAVAAGEQIHQVLIAVGNVSEAELALPIPGIFL